jgi:hypothetical protein
MAERPVPVLTYADEACPDCGSRRAAPPRNIVSVPEDVDLSARDFEGFRQVMLESLASDNPDRERWSEADLEVALVEVLAAGLDRLSHSLDTFFAERFLDTAQWPRSVVRGLVMIDGVAPAISALRGVMREDEVERFGFDRADIPQAEALFALLSAHPQLMDLAKAAALAEVNRLESCISLSDVARKLRDIPVFAQVDLNYRQEGAYSVYEAAILMQGSGWRLHDRIAELGAAGQQLIEYLMAERLRLDVPVDLGFSSTSLLTGLSADDLSQMTIRSAISHLISPLMPLSSRLRLIEGQRIGVYLSLCVEIEPRYFRSEVELALRDVLSARPGGLFDPIGFGFGAPLYVSDLQERLTALPGVMGVIVNRLRFTDGSGGAALSAGVLRPPPRHALSLDNENADPSTGYYVLTLTGGLIG